MTSSAPQYSRTSPFLASLKTRYSLSKPGSKKKTQHVTLDIRKSDLSYNVGDSIGVFPSNDPQVVEQTLQALKARKEEIVTDPKSGASCTLKEFLSKKANITEPNKKLLSEIFSRQSNVIKKKVLENLLQPENKQELKQYLAMREVWDLLVENPEVTLAPQEFCSLLRPMLPRFYSIASSPRAVGGEIDLAVAMLEYETNSQQRKGVCSHYLCHLVNPNKPLIPIFVQPAHHFSLSEDPNVPIIMIGPGTGIAPFRAFMQERVATNAQGKCWLFFGEWNRAYDFFYEEFWTSLEAAGKLQLDLAFSRDQTEKVYVQHKMLEKGQEVFSWLEEGAYLYVCGDAQKMAKEVEEALHKIVQQHGNKNEGESKEYIKSLRKEKRYLKDVY